MIPPLVAQKVKFSTCSIIYMPVKHGDVASNAEREGIEFNPIMIKTKVLATGFLIKENIVLTNRHVIAEILKDRDLKGNHDNWYVKFTFQKYNGHWTESTRRIKNLFVFGDPDGGGRMDVGLLYFDNEDKDLGCYGPVEFGELSDIVAGNDIAICGFPFGNELLDNLALGVRRAGPVLHVGIISAIAPIDNQPPRNITCFLTDLNSAGGMSGSPVFLPSSGRVIGVHYAGAQGTMGYAIPIDQTRIDSWVAFLERSFSESPPPDLYLTQGGDIVDPPATNT